jgi:hypothetical protein
VLDEDVDEDGWTVALAQLPEEVPFAALELGCDKGGVDPLEGREVELADPRLVDEPADQLLDQPRMGKQRTVAQVMLPQRLFSCPCQATPRSHSPMEHEWPGNGTRRRK